jgi:hypothetical protein
MKEIRAWVIIVALNLVVVLACAYDSAHREPEPTEEVIIEVNEDIIQWKQEEPTEIHIEEIEVETVTEPRKEEVTFYNVPLSEELQLHIFKECEKYNIAPALVMALIERESDFDVNALSPYGDKGLMQVNPRWHTERAEKLGCTDLFNPFDNITVGIDYLAELKAEKPDVYWVLMAYNKGREEATERLNNEDYSSYAVGIVERAGEIESEVEYVD